ncbi:MAG: CPBP family intramembrane metalloprotease [Clostridioides sp.]|nr:CPBP family intramembrane metalloprotease [Clostridioides sp.]
MDKKFMLFTRRSNIENKSMPRPGDGLIAYLLALVFLFTIGAYLQYTHPTGGIVATELVLASIPIIYSLYIKADLKEVFQLRVPKLKYVFLALGIYISGYVIILMVTAILINVVPNSTEVVDSLNKALNFDGGLLFNILITAGTPAICEELLFRGFIFSAFKNVQTTKTSKKTAVALAILGSSILFGSLHYNLIRVIPTAILGVLFAYSAYRAGSIYPAMMLHFINNSISVIAMQMMPDTVPDISLIFGGGYNIIGICFILVSVMFYMVIENVIEKNHVR